MTLHIKFWQRHCNVSRPIKTYTLAGFEPGIFCSGGGRDDHYATPPGLNVDILAVGTTTPRQKENAALQHILRFTARAFKACFVINIY
jgi:hypothetical protein